MAVEPGQTLLHYRIVEQIGEGGMGVVWKAVDTTLDREVAIKVLTDAFVADGERLARFEREAKLLASLNHPNIASIYGLHEQPASGAAPALRFLSMELIGGEDLSEALTRGPLPTAQAIDVALQIVAALETAHDNGIVHRDLKPANIRFTASGSSIVGGTTGTTGSVAAGQTLKVLDFGLAKALDSEGADQNLTQSPTLTGMATQAGVILGTASYMSPEQARGQPADRRADIFSFGVVLYEMLTGKRPFGGNTVSDTLADILRAEADLDALPSGTPLQVRRLLVRCLAKEQAQRLQSIGDARLKLRDAQDAPEFPATSPTGATTPERKGGVAVMVWAAVALLASMAAIWGWTRPVLPTDERTALSIALPAGEELESAPAISRDGRQVAYVSRRGVEPTRLYVRSLDAFEARVIPGTEHAQQPFFSPDGRSIGFFNDRNLAAVELSGGSPRVLAAAPNPFGATWADDGHIIFTTTINAGLMRIPSTGGTIENLTTPDMGALGYAHVWPRALPGGKQIVFSIWASAGEPVGGTTLLDRTTGDWEPLVEVSGGVPVESGHLLTPWDDVVEGDSSAARVSVMAPGAAGPLAFDATVLTGVFSVPWRSDLWLSVASNGTLAYVPGTVADRRLVWVDRTGEIEPAESGHAVHDNLALSPDGRRAVVKNGNHLWVHDLVAGTRIRLTSEESNGGPVWDLDNRRVYFSSNRSGDWNIYVRSADGTGETEQLLDREFSQWAQSVAPDGTLLYTEPHPETGDDIWVRQPDGETSPFLLTPMNETDCSFSPDGRHIAYASNESGRYEVFVVPYPGPGSRVPISRDGGNAPRWSKDGKTLFYLQGDTTMAASLDRGANVEVTGLEKLFSGKFMVGYSWSWGVAPDGRFLMVQRGPGSVPDRINVVLNWTEELPRRAPGG